MRIQQTFKPKLVTMAVLAALDCIGVAQAAIEIEQKPLSGGGASIPPNIMLVWDDSGSMSWNYMPDNVPQIGGASITTAYTTNTIYYNPFRTYTPWRKADGTGYANASYTSASSNTTNLTSLTNLSSSQQCFHVPINHGGNLFSLANYYRYRFNTNGTVERCSANATCSNNTSCTPVTSFSWTDPDGTVTTRTIAQEKQNFANWYHFYRTRNKMAKAAISQAFVDLGPHYRVGIRFLNNNATKLDIPVTGDFEKGGTNRTNFYDSMLTAPASGVTPTRGALRATGEYFRENTSDTGPWGPKGDDGKHVSCRQSYVILTTDGYWNETNFSSGPGNSDNTDGPVHTHADGVRTYQYKPKAPFKDGQGDTLADVAMEYWKKDLRSDLPNNVGVQTLDADSPEQDGAFWQHLVTYGVAIGSAGTLDQETAWPQLKAGTMNWPTVPNNSPQGIDDLWHATVNGRGTFLLANDAQELSKALSGILQSIAVRANSGSSGSVSGALITSDSLFYKPRYSPGDWSGDLEGFKFDGNGEPLSVPYWKASERMPLPGVRKLFTLTSAGQPTTFDTTGLDTQQKAALNATTSVANDMINYLRGDPSKEQSQSGGVFRNRTRPTGHETRAPIGDIVQSSPVYVSSTNFGYGFYQSMPEHDDYQDFVDTKKNWAKRVYVGSNDGVLHSFNALTGVEEFGYIPSMLIPELSKLTDPDYDHQYYVDGLITVDDACLSGCDAPSNTNTASWKTVLVGSLGAGGAGWFALDVTAPTASDPATLNRVLWELKHSDDSTDAVGKIKVDADLGQSPFIQARVVKLNSGEWAAVFGNGYNSTSGRGYLFVVRLSDGEILAKLPAGTLTENGLGTPQIFDDNGDGKADFAYVGDIRGNLWKFDLQSQNKLDWANPLGNDPLFHTTMTAGKEQPITTAPRIYKDRQTGVRYVAFGTGKYFSNSDVSSTEVQSIYGFADTNETVERGDLKERKIVYQVGTNRVTDKSEANDLLGKKGWYLDLLNQGTEKLGERVRAEPALMGGRVIVGTYQTAGSDICAPEAQGWIMTFDIRTGGRPSSAFFDIDRDGVVGSVNDFVTIGSEKVAVSGFSPGVGGITGLSPVGGAKPGEAVKLIYSGSGGSSGAGAGGIDIEAPYVGRTGWKELSVD